MNYCEETVLWANTREIGNVVYHEYGHGLSQLLYEDGGDELTESDLSRGQLRRHREPFLDRTSIVGFGFFNGDCTRGIRAADNELRYPEDLVGEGHADGRILAGFYWDLWQELQDLHPTDLADSIAFHAWHYARALGLPHSQPDQVLWTFLADDDDADVTNGTPNHESLCAAALAHGFECPEITTGVLITHEGTPHFEDGSQGFDVVATIVSTEAALDASATSVEYRVNGGAFRSAPLTPTGNPDEFAAHLPALRGHHSRIEYYVRATDLSANSRVHPPAAPARLHSFDLAWRVDDFEGGGGWSTFANGDDATTGLWERMRSGRDGGAAWRTTRPRARERSPTSPDSAARGSATVRGAAWARATTSTAAGRR